MKLLEITLINLQCIVALSKVLVPGIVLVSKIKSLGFSDKNRHQTFLEPEGLNSEFIYLQGISTSLPEDVQIEFLKTIPGLENVELFRPGLCR